MQNRTFNKLNSIIKVKIEGKNINNYIKRLIKNNISILKLIPISYKEVHIIINYSEYKKITKYTTTYKLSIIDNYGILKIKKNIKRNIYLLLSLIIGLLLIIFLSNITFSINIIHQDKNLRNLIKEELNNAGLKKYRFKKGYNELEQIEDKILKKNKDKIEWIEIINEGTNYTVRIEERKKDKKRKLNTYQNIISRKEAIITSINAQSGEKVKFINEYVKKGDIIISGYITMPDNKKIPTIAKGKVYGEVWYQAELEYPFIYQEEKLTGNYKINYTINFLGKNLSILKFPKYKTFKRKNKVLLSNLFNNISLNKEKQYELIVKDEVYPEDIALNKAKDYLKQKLKKDNHKIKSINKISILSEETTSTTIKLKLFISAIENIGITSKIDENIINKNNNN